MGDKRQFRKAGDILLLGQTSYRLESVEGCGGSTVVYRASYEDGLNQGCRHYVFIKELFPYHPKGNIYRNHLGEICCREDGAAVMEQGRQNFYRGNQANLRLLEQSPERVSGNLNSYSAYGTYYSVLAVHGGECMETLLEEGRPFGTLRETAEALLKILEAVECFHDSGLLHLDISPDNILLLPGQALLIDYNSVWEMDGRRAGEQCFSEKEGYSAPEIYLKQRADIGTATDLYSVCAVWFRMLTGKCLSDQEIIGNRLRKSLCQDLEIFRGQPVTAVWKTTQIMVKGLCVLARRRYQSARKMRGDVEELILRIDRKGISHSALWECSRQAWETVRRDGTGVPEPGQGKTQYLKRMIRAQDGTEYGQEAYVDQLHNGGRLLLTGAGGMGKTSFIMWLWEQAVRQYRPGMSVVMYVPLIGYQQAQGDACYIRKYILRHIGLQGQADGLESAVQELERQLDSPGGWKLVLLLDGLNEAGEKKKLLLKEIEMLGKKPAVGILITDRSDCVKKYGLYDFQATQLLPLTKAQVLQALGQEADVHIELLRNPLMLFLYQKILEMSENTDGTAAGLESVRDREPQELIGLYLDSLCMWQNRVHSGNPVSQLRTQYLIYHFLPEVSAEMRRRRKTLLNLDELYNLAQRTYKGLGNKDFAMAFPEYLGKSRQLLEGIHDAMEWLDYAVGEQLAGALDLMRKKGERSYCLVHDNFAEYLAAQAVKNRRKVSVYRRKAKEKKLFLIFVLLSALTAGGIYARHTGLVYHMSGKERYQFREVLYQTGRNLGALGTQIQIQQQILEEAAKREVLEGEAESLSKLAEWSEYKRQQAAQYGFERSKNKDALENLERADAGLPLRIMEGLLDKTYEMDVFMEEGLAHLSAELEKTTLSYTDREELVAFYQQYLDVYTETTYREMVMVLVCLEEDLEGEMLDIIGQTPVFREYIRKYPYDGKSMKVLETELKSARTSLRECRNRMKTRNYQISLPEWQ